jgi:hypothetical protein
VPFSSSTVISFSVEVLLSCTEIEMWEWEWEWVGRGVGVGG